MGMMGGAQTEPRDDSLSKPLAYPRDMTTPPTPEPTTLKRERESTEPSTTAQPQHIKKQHMEPAQPNPVMPGKPKAKSEQETKEYWLKQMNRSDNEILALKHELGLFNDRRKIILFEMEQARKQTDPETDDQDMNTKNESSRDLIKRIYKENKQKRLACITSEELVPSHNTEMKPLHKNLLDYEEVKTAVTEFQRIQPKLVEKNAKLATRGSRTRE